MNYRDKIEYMVVFVSEFAKHYSLSIRNAYNYLHTYKALAFIESQYNIAHTMSFEYMINSMAAYCRKNGGEL